MGYNYHIIGMDSDRNVYTAVQYCSLLTEFSERYYMNYACTTCSSNWVLREGGLWGNGIKTRSLKEPML